MLNGFLKGEQSSSNINAVLQKDNGVRLDGKVWKEWKQKGDLYLIPGRVRGHFWGI